MVRDMLISTIDPKSGKIRWVRKGNLHLTIRFLGPTPEESLDDINALLAKQLRTCTPFKLQIEDTGCFPKPERPRVLWLGIEGQVDELQKVVQRINSGLESLGFPTEEREYHPHLTLARIKYPQKRTPEIQNFLNTTYEPIPLIVDRLQFISSELFPNGPVYTILGTHFFHVRD
jgi:2'-5' RNA ligase